MATPGSSSTRTPSSAVVPDGGQQLPSDLDPDAETGRHPRCGGAHEYAEFGVSQAELRTSTAAGVDGSMGSVGEIPAKALPIPPAGSRLTYLLTRLHPLAVEAHLFGEAAHRSL
jgi:hypothetical protein